MRPIQVLQFILAIAFFAWSVRLILSMIDESSDAIEQENSNLSRVRSLGQRVELPVPVEPEPTTSTTSTSTTEVFTNPESTSQSSPPDSSSSLPSDPEVEGSSDGSSTDTVPETMTNAPTEPVPSSPIPEVTTTVQEATTVTLEISLPDGESPGVTSSPVQTTVQSNVGEDALPPIETTFPQTEPESFVALTTAGPVSTMPSSSDETPSDVSSTLFPSEASIATTGSTISSEPVTFSDSTSSVSPVSEQPIEPSTERSIPSPPENELVTESPEENVTDRSNEDSPSSATPESVTTIEPSNEPDSFASATPTTTTAQPTESSLITGQQPSEATTESSSFSSEPTTGAPTESPISNESMPSSTQPVTTPVIDGSGSVDVDGSGFSSESPATTTNADLPVTSDQVPPEATEAYPPTTIISVTEESPMPLTETPPSPEEPAPDIPVTEPTIEPSEGPALPTPPVDKSAIPDETIPKTTESNIEIMTTESNTAFMQTSSLEPTEYSQNGPAPDNTLPPEVYTERVDLTTASPFSEGPVSESSEETTLAVSEASNEPLPPVTTSSSSFPVATETSSTEAIDTMPGSTSSEHEVSSSVSPPLTTTEELFVTSTMAIGESSSSPGPTDEPETSKPTLTTPNIIIPTTEPPTKSANRTTTRPNWFVRFPPAIPPSSWSFGSKHPNGWNRFGTKASGSIPYPQHPGSYDYAFSSGHHQYHYPQAMDPRPSLSASINPQYLHLVQLWNQINRLQREFGQFKSKRKSLQQTLIRTLYHFSHVVADEILTLSQWMDTVKQYSDYTEIARLNQMLQLTNEYLTKLVRYQEYDVLKNL